MQLPIQELRQGHLATATTTLQSLKTRTLDVQGDERWASISLISFQSVTSLQLWVAHASIPTKNLTRQTARSNKHGAANNIEL